MLSPGRQLLFEPITRQCLQCGTTFRAHSHDVKRGYAKYCSRQCYGLHLRALPKRSLESRFWQRVDTSGECWIWQGGRDTSGYGKLTPDSRAHRISWELNVGPVPEGLWVLHRCDNPPCVRPDHLFLGTLQDNVADMVSKGRGVAGVRHPMAKVTPEIVLAIRTRYSAGNVTQHALAREYGLVQSQISHIVRGKQWSSVH